MSIFSVVAQNPKRLGFKDEKGKLFFEICRILRFAKPRCFLVENVKGLLSANNGQAFDLIIKEFSSISIMVFEVVFILMIDDIYFYAWHRFLHSNKRTQIV